MRFKSRLTLVLVAFFTLSLTAYAGESNQAHATAHRSESSPLLTTKAHAEPAGVEPNITQIADKILAEETEASARIIDDSFRGSPNSVDKLRSSTSADSLVSTWLETRAAHTSPAIEPARNNLAAKPSHVHNEQIETEMGGGWCDLCGCWLRHGHDPNGTPESEIGHAYVCAGGGQSCSMHQYRSCASS